MRRLPLLLIALWATAAEPGAWPREVGETFLSAKGAFLADGDAGDPVFTLYAERGATERLTLGGKVDRLTETLAVAESFARWHFSAPDATWQLAAEAGVALTYDQAPETWPTWRDRVSVIAAAHLGRGVPTPVGGGWIDMRLGGVFPLNDEPRRLKLDATAGVALASGHLLMAELRHEATEAETLTFIGPAAAFSLGERLKLTAGAFADVSGDLPTKLEIGAWLTF